MLLQNRNDLLGLKSLLYKMPELFSDGVLALGPQMGIESTIVYISWLQTSKHMVKYFITYLGQSSHICVVYVFSWTYQCATTIL